MFNIENNLGKVKLSCSLSNCKHKFIYNLKESENAEQVLNEAAGDGWLINDHEKLAYCEYHQHGEKVDINNIKQIILKSLEKFKTITDELSGIITEMDEVSKLNKYLRED